MFMSIITNFIKDIWRSYKWQFITVISVIVFFVFVFIFRNSDGAQKVLDWVVDKRMEILEDSISDKKKAVDEDKEKIKDIENKIGKLRKKREQNESKYNDMDLKESSEAWDSLGY